jgi:RNA polymerase sigma factor for flagellar operon FliA
MSRQDLEAKFLANLPAAERILSALARRHALLPEVAEDFGSWAKLKLIENDYAILAKFRGESSITTYLTVVLAMLFREYRVHEWGRWRPSAEAKRGGALAIRLDTLLNRDNVPLAQAGEILRTAGETSLSDRELADIAAAFPMRTPLRPIQAIQPGTDAAGPYQADDGIQADEAETESSAAKRALAEALQSLPTEEQLIVRLHFMESMTVADIARGLSVPQKPLYRRLERALRTLRDLLERAGVSRDHVRELATGPP